MKLQGDSLERDRGSRKVSRRGKRPYATLRVHISSRKYRASPLRSSHCYLSSRTGTWLVRSTCVVVLPTIMLRMRECP